MEFCPGNGNRNSVKFLRACFKKQVLGGGRTSPAALRFWTAVNTFAPTTHAQLDKAGSSRTMAELQAAYDFVSSLLADDPAALFLFLSNGTPGVSNEVPGLVRHVDDFLRRNGGGADVAAPPPLPSPPSPPTATVKQEDRHARVGSAELGDGFRVEPVKM